MRALPSHRAPTAPRRERPAHHRRDRTAPTRATVGAGVGEYDVKKLPPFPRSADAAVVQARAAVRAALAAGRTLVEVEIPPTLTSVAGDGDGAAEMLAASTMLRSLLREFAATAATTRVYFPDAKEAAIATGGRGMDPAAGSAGVPPTFAGGGGFRIDHLTEPNGLSDVGLDWLFKRDIAATVAPDDTLLACAFPSFNVNEFLAIRDLWAALHAPAAAAARRPRGAAAGGGQSEGEGAARRPPPPPILVFNGELDRIVSGYYPPLFYPKVAAAGRELLDVATNPGFVTAYYIKNFKSRTPGTLFRCFPGPWTVLAGPLGEGGRKVVYAGDQRPTLKEVALEMLPRAYGRDDRFF